MARTAASAESTAVAGSTRVEVARPALTTDSAAEHAPPATIKLGERRLVTRELAESGAVYVKWYFARSGWDWCQRRLRGDPAQREARLLRLAQSRGVPVPELLDIGRASLPDGRAASFLTTREIAGAVPLRDLPPRTEVPGAVTSVIPQRPQLVERLGQLVGRLHAARLTHLDLHAGNILVRLDCDGWRAWLVDLMELRRHRRAIGVSAAAENLSRLACSLHPWLTAADDRRFWNAYAAERAARGDFTPTDALARQFEQARREAFERIWRRADGIWRRGNSKLLVTPHGRGLARLGRAALIEWQEQATELWQQGLVLDAAEPQSRSIRWRTPDGVVPFRMVRVTNGSTARAVWETGHALRRRGLPAAVPWAIVERDSEPGWVLYRDPSDAVPLNQQRLSIGQINAVHRLLRRAEQLGFAWDCLTAMDIATANDGCWIGFRHLEQLRLRRCGWVSHAAPAPNAFVWDSPATCSALSVEGIPQSCDLVIPVL